MIITGFPDDIDLNPEGYRDLAFVKNFRDVKSGVTLNVESFVLNRSAHKRLDKWLYQEQGRFENVPVTITTNSGTVLPHYLDLKVAKIGTERSTTGIQARKSVGHFFDDADFLTFELLNLKGALAGLSNKVPYIIVPDNVEIQGVITTITILSLTYQFFQAIFEIEKSFAAFLDVFPGTGILTALAQLVALIIFFVFTVVALIQAINALKELVFPTLREFKAFRDLDLIRAGCEFLGYTLDSNVLEQELSEIHTIGVPEAVPNKSIFNFFQNQQTAFFNKGYPTAQDSTPTLGSLIDFYLKTFNLRIFVFEGVVKIERRLFFANSATINIIPSKTDQEKHTDEYTFNEDDAWGRAYDHWQVDYSDIHSPDTFDGMKSEHITEQISTLNTDLVRLVGLKQNSAPYALAGRKKGFNKIEQSFLTVFKKIDEVISKFDGSPTNLASIITKRDGVMVIEKQFFAVTKKIKGTAVNGEIRQDSDYKDFLSMGTIYNNFKLDLEVNVNNFAGKTMRVPFTDENYTSLLQNNFVNMDGEDDPIEVVHIEWFDKQLAAIITLLLPDDSAFNTKTITLT